MPYTATELRNNIYRVLDRVIETGEAVEVERNGKVLRISVVSSVPPVERVRGLTDLIVGDPASLEHVDWSSEWKP